VHKNNLKKPSLSIITVVYNGERYLEQTIKSIINQTYNNIEYIIIDGASTDGTIDIIKKYEDHIDYWISEPDEGIYDAMNKGIASASNKYLWFVNAGDEIYKSNVVENIFSAQGYDIYYGHIAPINNNQEVIKIHFAPPKLTFKQMFKGMIVSHQAIIIRKSLLLEYNLHYQCVADYDWIIKALKNTNAIYFTNIVFAKYLIGGFSNQHFKQCWQERFIIVKEHFSKFYYWITYYFYFYAILQQKKIIIYDYISHKFNNIKKGFK